MMITNKIILGTAQLGIQYGINNSIGIPNIKEAFKILKIAKENGINTIDTAEAYGNAIDIIGKFYSENPYSFNVISKFEFKEAPNLQLNVHKTLTTLHIERLFAYLLHNADQLSNLVTDSLGELKHSGLIEYAGVSIYTNEQFHKAIYNDQIDIIQIPYNLLDNTNLRGALIKEAKINGKIIHIRSVFLQGLFYMQKDIIPLNLQIFQKYLSEIKKICDKFSISVATVALHYGLGNGDIDGVLIGVDSANQLLENIFDASKAVPVELISLINTIIVKETELLNPVNWH